MNDLERKNAALRKMANTAFGASAVDRIEFSGRDVYVDISDSVTLTNIEALMKLLDPASVSVAPLAIEERTELGFYACRLLPWEL